MSKTIFVYTMEGCPYCAELKQLLTDANIDFVVRDTDEYELQYEILKNNTDNDYVPAIEIRDDEKMTKRFLVPERDFEELEEAVERIKFYIDDSRN
jgi:glutaredoxin